IRVEVGDSTNPAAVISQNFFGDAFGPDFAVSGCDGSRDHGVLCPAFRIDLAHISNAPAATHARTATVVWDGVSQHGNVKRMKSEALGGRFQNPETAIRRERRHGQWPLARCAE